MDDANNGEYSRTPKIEDLVRLCEALNREGVRYVLIGGFAVMIHGFTRATKDIDLLLDPDPKNIQKLKKAMVYLPDKAILSIEDDDVGNHVVVRVADEIVVDLMAKACGVTYDEAFRDADVYEIEGVDIVLVNKEILIKTKNTVRPSDKMDTDFLKSQIAEEKNKKN